ncbi:DNA polymerase gamma [Endogone sp. FLAS-F59071]|nr:DNA polymerase gamma [Endogone sp. FLAS-F59071]|eukprot:RUS20538.1 DNA polymerase gamma [Endogone sp. FLAS-F59071]
MFLRTARHLARTPSPANERACMRLLRPALLPRIRAYSSERQPESGEANTSEEVFLNKLKIQMLSHGLYNQVFPNHPRSSHPSPDVDAREKLAISHLLKQEIWGKDVEPTHNLSFPLPPLSGPDIQSHFYQLGLEQAYPYLDNAKRFAEVELPPLPDTWSKTPGWTRYKPGEKPEPVEYPMEDELVFDVEVLQEQKPYPTLAVAASEKAWYSWTSRRLATDEESNELIQMGPPNVPRLIIGHNVGYDRARIHEEYHVKKTQNGFVDTMSLHIAVAGLCSQQRPAWLAKNKQKEMEEEDGVSNNINKQKEEDGVSSNIKDKIEDNTKNLLPFYDVSSTNSLKDVVKFYCNYNLDKSSRDWFVNGTILDIHKNFQSLVSYCASDVYWTHEVYRKVLPRFFKYCPHPVSFAGILHMGNSFLTVDDSWDRYIASATRTHEELETSVVEKLRQLAERAVEEYKNNPDAVCADLWLGQLDWTISKRQRKCPGYPKWYSDAFDSKTKQLKITVRSRLAPILLRLKWLNFPLFYNKEHGWCYRVPLSESNNHTPKTPHFMDDVTGELCARIPHKDGDEHRCGTPIAKPYVPYFEDKTLDSEHEVAREALELNLLSAYWIIARERIRGQFVVWENGSEGVLDLGLKLEDRKKDDNSVDAPDLELEKREDGRNDDNSAGVPDSEKRNDLRNGIILPQVITMGAITRRAVEPTWMTASNAKLNRVGSELKAMVRAPAGYSIVGADVDSEELWISSLMGDAQFGFHGATALGWMTLQGTKTAKTDLHSKTAGILGIDRNKAKVFNYARIYGAGEKYAAKLLLQSNPDLTPEDATKKAKELYKKTKGKRAYVSSPKRMFWWGGTESYMFNALERIAMGEDPRTPVLGCAITAALHPRNFEGISRNGDFLTSRINWVVQSSGVDYLHLMIVSMAHLIKKYDIKARFMISVHDEIRYLATNEDRLRTALALQIANLWTRCLFSSRVGLNDLPQSVAFFSAVDIDHVLRKETDMPCLTPSNKEKISEGMSLTITQLIEEMCKVNVNAEELLGPVMDRTEPVMDKTDMLMATIPIPQPLVLGDLKSLKMQMDMDMWRKREHGGFSTITIEKNENMNRNDKPLQTANSNMPAEKSQRVDEWPSPEVFKQSEMDNLKKTKKKVERSLSFAK